MRFKEIISELALTKNKWELLISSSDKEELGTDLVNLVQHAYSNTLQGSFVNSIRDVIPSDWKVIDWDQDPDVDACIFYRKPRATENWIGYKVQGIGHDGQKNSKSRVIEKLEKALNISGWWIESSDAMRHILKTRGADAVTDEEFLKTLFSDPDLMMVDRDTYIRKLSDGKKITETVFGKPILK